MMKMTHGQILAIEQIKEIEAASDNTLSVENITVPTDGDSLLQIGISVKCGSYPRRNDGLKFRERELFRVLVGQNFPFEKPGAITTHKRFSDFPHVQWGSSLCLYIAPDVEWQPADGMYGFIDRLKLWIEKAALNELDPEGAPIHPPVTYTSVGKTHSVVIKKNTSQFDGDFRFGLAHINKIDDRRFDVNGWQIDDSVIADTEYVGAVLLLNKKMPFEFPTKISDLLELLNLNGIPTDRILFQFQIAVLNNKKKEPLIFIIGTPMRGIVGDELKQHLMAWYIYPDASDALRITIKKYSDNEGSKEIGERVEKILMDEWVKKCGVNWCNVLEARPEVTKRRDLKSPMSCFRDLNVEVWGCGALGANIAISLARANVKSLKLIDNGIVKPGLLVRQPFFEKDIARPKVYALKDHIKMIDPNLKVENEVSNILNTYLGEDKLNSEADIIFDCTASNSVRYKLELTRTRMSGSAPDICSMMLDANAKYAALAFSPQNYSGGSTDIYRKAKIEAKKYPELNSLIESFFSKESDNDLFQPEPGCSSPTFIASAADVSAIANSLLNVVAKYLKEMPSANGKSFFIKQPHHEIDKGRKEGIVKEFSYQEDFVQVDPINEYEVRYSKNAIRDLQGYINKNSREGHIDSETGGILWGELDEVLKIIWVTEASGPPPDSNSSPDQFICGIEGVAQMNKKKTENSSGSVSYLGIWHTHPKSEPLPSRRDYDAVYNLLKENELSSKKVFISIIGSLDIIASIGSYVFGKDNFLEVVTRYE